MTSTHASKRGHRVTRPNTLGTTGRILRSVLRPVHVDPHYASWRKPRWWGGGERITVGQARVTGTEPTLGRSSLDVARLAPGHCPRKRVDVARKNRKEVEASVPARIR